MADTTLWSAERVVAAYIEFDHRLNGALGNGVSATDLVDAGLPEAVLPHLLRLDMARAVTPSRTDKQPPNPVAGANSGLSATRVFDNRTEDC